MRKRWFALLGMLVIFAWTSALAQDVSFGPSIKVNDDTTDRNQLSPSLAVDREGNLYLAWEDLRNLFITGRINTYFSSSFDGGRTWTKNRMIDPDRGTPGDPRLACDTSGNIYFVWSDEPRGEIYFSLSCDRGTTWTQAVRIDDDPYSSHNPALAVDDKGWIYVVWTDTREDWDIYFAMSTDAGTSWTSNVRVNNPPLNLQLMSDITVDENGVIYVVWLDFRSGKKWDLYFSKSADAGSTWSLSKKVNNDDINGSIGSDPSLVVDGNGGLYVVWTYQGNNTAGVYFSRSGNGGWSWTRTVRVNSDSIYYYTDPCLSIDEKGRLYVAWNAGPEPGGNISHVYFSMSRDSGRTWSDSVIRVDDCRVGAGRASFQAIGNGELYVAWDGSKDSVSEDIYFSSDTLYSGIDDWKDNPAVIRDFKLYQNYPNPFNANTAISYQLSAVSYQQSAISLRIYNILGQEVKTLVDEKQTPGYYSVVWDGKDDQGKDLASGVYFCKLECGGGFIAVRKLVLLR